MIKRVMAAAFALSLLAGTSALAQQQHDDHNGGGGQHDHGGGGGGGQHGGGGAPHGAGGAPGGPGGGQHGGAPAGGGVVSHGGPPGGGAPHVAAPPTPPPPPPGGSHPNVNPGAGFGAGGITYQPHSPPSGGQPGGGHNGPGGQNNGGGPRPGQGGGGNPGPGGQGNWHGGGNPGGHGDWHGAGGGRGGPPNANFHPRFGVPGARPGGQRPQYNPSFFPHSYHPTQRFQWRGGYWRPPHGYYQRHWRYGDRLPWGWFSQSFWIDDYDYYDLPVPPFGYEWVRLGPDALLVDQSDGEVVSVVRGIFY